MSAAPTQAKHSIVEDRPSEQMGAIASLLFVVATSALIARIATSALEMTGVSRELAYFQARSAYSGVGLAIRPVNRPSRRNRACKPKRPKTTRNPVQAEITAENVQPQTRLQRSFHPGRGAREAGVIEFQVL
jgi:hypothetical protein